MTVVPLSEWLPDKPALAGGSTIAQNVIPRTAESYGPVPAFALAGSGPLTVAPTALFNALSAGSSQALSVQIAACPIDPDADNPTGTNMAFYAQAPSNGTGGGWVSLGEYSGIAPIRFAQFKNNVLATTGYAGSTPLSWTMTTTPPTGFFSQLAQQGAAPASPTIWIANDFCVLGNTIDPIGGYAPYRIWWSAFNDPTNWPTPGSAEAVATQSDYNDFDGTMGEVTGGCGSLLNASMLVFFHHGVQMGSYVGPSNVFNFYPVANARGTNCTDSIVVVAGTAYYLAENGFYSCDGINIFPIGLDKINNWAVSQGFANFNSYTDGPYASGVPGAPAVVGGFWDQERLLWWMMPGATESLMLFYHPYFQRWSYAVFPAMACAMTGTGNSSFGLSITGGAYGAPQGGSCVPAALDQQGNMWTVSGASMAATVSTVEMQPIPGLRGFVKGARLIGDAAEATIATARRLTLQGPQIFGPDNPITATGSAPQRCEGRYLQAIVKVPAGTPWSSLQSVDVSVVPSGSR